MAFGLRTRGDPEGGPARTAAARLAGPGRSRRAGRPAARRSCPAARRSGRRWPGPSSATPPLLLLDEPLSALDARTRLTVRAELRRHLAEFAGSTVLVTHDPVDAMALADRVVVVEDGTRRPGRHARRGRPRTRAPTTSPASSASSLLPGTGDGAHACGSTAAAWWPWPRRRPGRCSPPSAPSRWPCTCARPEGSPRNVWPATLVGATPHGATVRCELAGEVPLVADVTATAFAELGLVPGRRVWATVKASEVAVYER